MFSSTPTYEMHPNPPAPMGWNEYEQRVMDEWIKLLNSEEGCEERRIHDFLVAHPSMIPGAYSVTGKSGHGPYPGAVLSESPLSALGVKVPDFIWLGKDSATFTPVFIEIESPCKRWFTKKKTPTSDLTQAMNQLAEWRAWLNRPENVAVFFESFEVPDYMRRNLTFRPEFVLIYGRRKEFEECQELLRLRDQFERHGQVVMTFDRLRPNRDCDFYISATCRNGRYQALAIPATLTLGPNTAQWFPPIDGIADAIRSNAWITEDRRRFLMERFPYWTAWAQRPNQGIVRGEYE